MLIVEHHDMQLFPVQLVEVNDYESTRRSGVAALVTTHEFNNRYYKIHNI